MEIKLKRTDEISDAEWINYVQVFNETFEKNYNIEYFKRKYLNTVYSNSFHSILYHKSRIVGSVSAIPLSYHVGKDALVFGSVVDLFIHKDHRNNPLSLRSLCNKLENELKANDVSFVYAVPNENSYDYLRKICEWKDIGELAYYALVYNPGAINDKLKRYNMIARIGSKLLVSLNSLSILVRSGKEHKSYIHIKNNQLLKKQRFDDQYAQVILNDDTEFIYRNYQEENGSVTYLYTFRKNNRKVLDRAVRHINKYMKQDLIIYIGLIHFNPLPLIKVPAKYQPERKLKFIGKILDRNKLDDKVYKLDNWDFSLLNFDAR